MLLLVAALVAVFLLVVAWRVSETRRVAAVAPESGGPGLLGLFALFTPAGAAIKGAKALSKV